MECKTAVVWGVGGPEGICTGMRGEGRWSVNVALLLRKLGIEVDMMGEESGIRNEYKDKQQGIRFVSDWFSQNKKYDLFFAFCPFWRDDPALWDKISKRVKVAIFGTFWPSINDSKPLPNAVLASPYRSFSSGCLVLPYSYTDTMESSKFSNKTLVWTSKGPFNTSMGEGRFLVNLYHLRATVDAVKNGYKAIFLSYGGDFLYEDSGMPLQNKSLFLEAKETLEELKKNPNVEFYDYLPCDKFNEILHRGSVSVRCDGCGSFSDTLLFGMVPTVFTTWFWPVFFNKTYTELPELQFYPYYNSVPEDVVKAQMFRLLTDEEYYNNRLKLLRQNTAIYTTDEAIGFLKRILETL